jgi:PAS domain S-box-containing protein
MLGYTRVELLRLSVAELVRPAEVEARLPAVRAELAAGRHLIDIWELRRGDGRYVPYELSHGFTPDGFWQAIVRDLTERTRAEKALRQSEARLRTLAELAPVLLWETDAEGRTVSRNQRWLEYTGQTVEESQRDGWLSAIHPDDREHTRRAVDAAVAAELPLELEHRIRSRVGLYRWFLIRQLPVRDDQQRVIRWLGAAIDIDAQRGALDAAKAARAEAETANRLKDEFLATLSHELRTPLAPILLWGRSLRDGQVPPHHFDRAASSIVQSAESQLKLIEDLLDLSRLQAGKLALERRRAAPEKVARTALDIIRPTAEAKQVTLWFDVEVGLGEMLFDPGRYQQVLWNLLSNAVKFTPAGGQVTLRVRRSGGWLVTAVTDTGEGVAPAFIDQLFQRFRQADTGDARRHGGLGIGLALCRYLVELEGGTIAAHSDGQGRGARFTVRMPWREPQLGRSGEETAVAAEETDLHGLSVLLVEDDPDTREVMAWTLERAGAQVSPVPDGARALAQLDEELGQRRERRMVIVCDIGLPGMSGYELIAQVARRCRERGAPLLPACAVSAHVREVDRRRAIDAGFDLYVAKPVDADVLVSAVWELSQQLDERLPPS